MNTKHVLAIAALLITSQAFALTAHQKQQGCDGDVGNCSSGLGPAGGGSGEASQYVSAFISEGSLWEMFADSQGGFTIETELSGGKKKVHIHDKAAYLIKPPPANSQMKRSALVYGPMAPALSAEAAKKKAEQEKAQAAAAAAKKAAEAKALAEAVQNAGGLGAYSAGLVGQVSAKPVAGGVISGASTVGAQPVAGMSNGPVTARKQP
ncbi:hypothetical protein [Polaromonas aquatica]|uniref:hypothetical protein n=1 Tax=Polaromonas aquatica TaxID=332657 RepID=UPI003D65B180